MGANRRFCPPKAEVVSSNLAGSATCTSIALISAGASARLNILLNTEQIVEKSRWPDKWHLRLGSRKG
jgi:hypothetical protein